MRIIASAASAAAALAQLPLNSPWQTYQLLRLLGSATLARHVRVVEPSVDAALPGDCQRLSGQGQGASPEAVPKSPCHGSSQRQQPQTAIWPFSGSARGLATWNRDRDRERSSSRGDSSGGGGSYGTWDERIVGGRAPDRSSSSVRGWSRQGNDRSGRGRGAGTGDAAAGGRAGSRPGEKLNNWQLRVRQFEDDAAGLCRRLEAANSWEELSEAMDLAPEPLLVGEQVLAALKTYCRISNAQRPRRQPGSSRSPGSGSGEQQHHHHDGNQQQPEVPPSQSTAPPARLTDRLRNLLVVEASGLKLRPLMGVLFALSTLSPEARQGLTHVSAPGAENPLTYMLNRLEFLLGQKAAAAEGAAVVKSVRGGGKGAGSHAGQQQRGGTEAEAEGQAATRVSGGFVSYICTALRKLHAATPALQRHLATLAAPALGRDLTGDYLAGVVLAFSRADTPDTLFLEKALHASAQKLSLQQLTAPFYACVLLDAASRMGLTEPKVLDPLADRLVQLATDSRKQALRQGAAREGQTHGSRGVPQKRKQEAGPAGAERDGDGGLGTGASTMGELGFRSVDVLRVLTACDILNYKSHKGLLKLLQEEVCRNRAAWPLQTKLQAAQHLLGLGVDVLERPPAQPDQEAPASQDQGQRVRTHMQGQALPLQLDLQLEQDPPALNPLEQDPPVMNLPASHPVHLASAAAKPEAAAAAGAGAEAAGVAASVDSRAGGTPQRRQKQTEAEALVTEAEALVTEAEPLVTEAEPLVTEAEVLAFLKRPELMVSELTSVLQALVRLRDKKPPGDPLAPVSSPLSPALAQQEATAATVAAATTVAAGEVALEEGSTRTGAPIPPPASTAPRPPAVRMPRALATAVHLVDAAAPLMKPHHIAGTLSALVMAGAVVPPAILLRAQALHVEAVEAGAAGAGGDVGSQRSTGGDAHEGSAQQQQQQQDRSQGQLRTAMRGAELRGMCAAVGRVLAWQPAAAAAANLSDGFMQSCRAAAWEGGRHA